ncbi:DNA helicase UvrD, partial [Streptomyces sp. SID10692]|nr:DNA helicase UvrD [Streptomyces sp. SID10692]
LTRLPADRVRAHREPAAVREGGRVEAYTYPTSSTELENIADLLRRAHLEDGVPWQEMAVLVRAGGRSLPAVRRALTSAGVPLEVDGDDVALRHEPAVAPLLTALRTVAGAALHTGRSEEAAERSEGAAGLADDTVERSGEAAGQAEEAAEESGGSAEAALRTGRSEEPA